MEDAKHPETRPLSRSPSVIRVVNEDAQARHSTDIVYELTFTKRGVTQVSFFGMPSCSGGPLACCRQFCSLLRLACSFEKRRVVILDARCRREELDYETCGFTLRRYRPTVSDWSQVTVSDSAQQKLFKAELEEQIRALHPDVKAIRFGGFLLRGGAGANPPATNGLHLDLYPDWERVEAVQATNPDAKEKEAADEETDKLELGLVLGLWMPREMNTPVHDYPFFFGDASTFAMPEDATPMYQDFQNIAEGGQRQRVINLASAAPKFSERQRYYYYNQQTSSELVVFRHLTQPAGGKACFHAAFEQLPLPDGMESRKSVETRAMLYFAPGSRTGADSCTPRP